MRRLPAVGVLVLAAWLAAAPTATLAGTAAQEASSDDGSLTVVAENDTPLSIASADPAGFANLVGDTPPIAVYRVTADSDPGSLSVIATAPYEGTEAVMPYVIGVAADGTATPTSDTEVTVRPDTVTATGTLPPVEHIAVFHAARIILPRFDTGLIDTALADVPAGTPVQLGATVNVLVHSDHQGRDGDHDFLLGLQPEGSTGAWYDTGSGLSILGTTGVADGGGRLVAAGALANVSGLPADATVDFRPEHRFRLEIDPHLLVPPEGALRDTPATPEEAAGAATALAGVASCAEFVAGVPVPAECLVDDPVVVVARTPTGTRACSNLVEPAVEPHLAIITSFETSVQFFDLHLPPAQIVVAQGNEETQGAEGLIAVAPPCVSLTDEALAMGGVGDDQRFLANFYVIDSRPLGGTKGRIGGFGQATRRNLITEAKGHSISATDAAATAIQLPPPAQEPGDGSAGEQPGSGVGAETDDDDGGGGLGWEQIVGGGLAGLGLYTSYRGTRTLIGVIRGREPTYVYDAAGSVISTSTGMRCEIDVEQALAKGGRLNVEQALGKD